jgi:hypothetical protein
MIIPLAIVAVGFFWFLRGIWVIPSTGYTQADAQRDSQFGFGGS